MDIADDNSRNTNFIVFFSHIPTEALRDGRNQKFLFKGSTLDEKDALLFGLAAIIADGVKYDMAVVVVIMSLVDNLTEETIFL